MSQEPHWTEPGAFCMVEGIHGRWAIDDSRRQLETALRSLDYRVADITRFLVTLETLTHLELLAAQGRVGRIEDDGMVRYRRSG